MSISAVSKRATSPQGLFRAKPVLSELIENATSDRVEIRIIDRGEEKSVFYVDLKDATPRCFELARYDLHPTG